MYTNKKNNILCFAESLIKIILIFCTFYSSNIYLRLKFFHYSIIWVHQNIVMCFKNIALTTQSLILVNKSPDGYDHQKQPRKLRY